MNKLYLKILVIILVLNKFPAWAQNLEYKMPDIEIGFTIFSYFQNPIGTSFTTYSNDKYLRRYLNGASFKYLSKNLNYRVDLSYFKYHNKYVLSEIITVDDYDEEVDGMFKRFSLLPGIEKDFLDYRIKPHIFVGINFYYTKYSGDGRTYSWGWYSDWAKFNNKSFGIGFLVSPGIRFAITDNVCVILESSLEINKNLKVDKRHIFRVREMEFKINPIETLSINYRFNLK